MNKYSTLIRIMDGKRHNGNRKIVLEAKDLNEAISLLNTELSSNETVVQITLEDDLTIIR